MGEKNVAQRNSGAPELYEIVELINEVYRDEIWCRACHSRVSHVV